MLLVHKSPLTLNPNLVRMHFPKENHKRNCKLFAINELSLKGIDKR